MCYARLVCLMTLAAGASGCGTDPLVCTDEFVVLTTAVVNRTGQQLPELKVRDTVLRTGTVLDVTGEHPSADLPVEGLPTIPISPAADVHGLRQPQRASLDIEGDTQRVTESC